MPAKQSNDRGLKKVNDDDGIPGHAPTRQGGQQIFLALLSKNFAAFGYLISKTSPMHKRWLVKEMVTGVNAGKVDSEIIGVLKGV